MHISELINPLVEKIESLESTVEFLKFDLHAATRIIDRLEPGKRYPWSMEWVNDDDGGFYKFKPIKVFPAKERNLLIKEFHEQGMTPEEISIALFERCHVNSRGAIWDKDLIEKVIQNATKENG